MRRITLGTVAVWFSSLALPIITYILWKCNLTWHDYRKDCATPLISLRHMKVIEHTIALLGISSVLLVLYLTYQEIKKSMLTPFDNFEMVNITSDSCTQNQTVKSLQQQFLKKERKSFEILLRMAVVYVITYLPMGITLIIWNVRWPKSRDYGLPFYILKEVSELVYVFSATVNPFITLCMKPGFRDIIVKRWNVVKNRISVRSRSSLLTG